MVYSINNMTDKKIYICDYLNLISDFREIKYKKQNVDFHSVKHENKIKDTEDFFDLFFTKYIQYVNIDRGSKFILVMKKLNGYDATLESILKKYRDLDIDLIIIEDKYTNNVVDKNKDDFLCQYIFYILQRTNNCMMISNDKYRDREFYINLFNFDMFITSVRVNKTTNLIERSSKNFEINKELAKYLVSQKCTRCTIPKHKLHVLL